MRKVLYRSVAAMLLLLVTTASAAASPECMTKSEARAAYPRSHIYWSGTSRCWSDRRGRSPVRRQHLRRPAMSSDMEEEQTVPLPSPKPQPLLAPPEIVPVLPPSPQPVQDFDDVWRRLIERHVAMAQAEPLRAIYLSFADRIPSSLWSKPGPEPEPDEPSHAVRWALAMVTGAAAFLGGWLSRRWQRLGWQGFVA